MASDLDMSMENLEEFINDENKVVTYRWLSLTLKLPCDTAKRLLSHYVSTHRPSEVLHVTYLVIGEIKTEDGVYETKVCVVPESRLEKTKQSLSSVSCVHIYSISKSRLSDTAGSLYTADYDSIRQNLPESTKYGGIVCASSALRSQEDVDSARSKGTYLPSTPQDTRNAPDPRLSKTSQNSPSKPTKVEKTTNEKNKPSAKGSLVSMFAAQKTIKKEIKEEPDNEKETKKSDSRSAAAPAVKKQNGISAFLKNGVDPREVPPKPPGRITRSSPRKAQVKKEEEEEDNVDDVAIAGKRSSKQSPTKSPPRKTYGRAKAKPATQPNRSRILKIESDSSDEDTANQISEDEEEPMPPSPPPAEAAVSDEEDPVPPIATKPKPPRGTKRKTVDRTFVGEDGFLVTKKEDVYVTDSEPEDAPPSPPPKKQDRTASPVKAAAGKSAPNVKKQTQTKKTSPAKKKQASIMSFFKKKENV